MKFLLLVLLVVIVYMMWRSGRRSAGLKAPGKPPPLPQDMVQCALCAVHLPASDAVQGQLGSYCCEQHRDHAEPT